jgi:hypothetical protein
VFLKNTEIQFILKEKAGLELPLTAFLTPESIRSIYNYSFEFFHFRIRLSLNPTGGMHICLLRVSCVVR